MDYAISLHPFNNYSDIITAFLGRGKVLLGAEGLLESLDGFIEFGPLGNDLERRLELGHLCQRIVALQDMII